MKKSDANEGPSASERISERIAELGDWRGTTLARMRKLIHEADPDVVEEWKWMGTPIWSHDGILCTGESYKKAVKLTFAKGAFLKDPTGLFNSSLEGNLRRAIDIFEGGKVDASAFQALIREAIVLNESKPAKKSKSGSGGSSKVASKSKPAGSAKAKPASLAKPKRASRSKAASAGESKPESKSKSAGQSKPASKSKPSKKGEVLRR